MTTRVSISLRSFISIGIIHRLRQALRLLVGRYVAEALREYEAFVQATTHTNDGRLTEAEIAAIRLAEEARYDLPNYQQHLLDLQISDDLLQHPEKASAYQQAALLCLPLLENRALGIRSMANVGTRVDIVCSYLAQKFPDVQFISIDLPGNLAAINSGLPQSRNWSFASGYALDLFERQAVTADLVLFSNTCEIIRNQELHQYFAALSKFARYIVLNEQWWPVHKATHFLRVLKPEDIDPDRSLPGGKMSTYQHNYPKILARSGFEVLSSEITDAPDSKFWLVKIVARNKTL